MKKVLEFLHKVKISLFPNQLTIDPKNYSDNASSERRFNINNIYHQVLILDRTSSTTEVMKYNVNFFYKEMTHQLANGIFTKASESFDADKQQ